MIDECRRTVEFDFPPPSSVADSSHLAAGPALGYVYQFQVALLELVPHALADADVNVSLEVFDDVAFDFEAGSARSVCSTRAQRYGRRWRFGLASGGASRPENRA
jgi:hypothetical protein